MGRKLLLLTEDQRNQVEALAAYLSQEQIADYFGIGKTTGETFNAMVSEL